VTTDRVVLRPGEEGPGGYHQLIPGPGEPRDIYEKLEDWPGFHGMVDALCRLEGSGRQRGHYRFLQADVAVPQTQAHQVFLGPSLLGIYRNYTISFGAQAPIFQSVGSQFPHERVRFAVNFSYLLFEHHH